MTELTLQRLKACGWTPDRKVDISPIEEFYDEKGIVMPQFLREFFTQYAFLHIEYYDSKRGVHEEHNLTPSDDQIYYRHIGIHGTAYHVGQAFRDNMDILYHNDGNFYIFMGGGPLIRAGNTVDDLMNALCGDYEHAVWKYIRH